MSSSRWEEHQEELESFRSEYDIVANHWRFLQGLRFIFLGIISTAYAALFGAYGSVFNIPNVNGWNRMLLVIIPIFGAVVSRLARLVDGS
jgi:hypothetical protein